MSTAGVLRNGRASNVFVRTKTKVYVRERPSDPRAGLKSFGIFGGGKYLQALGGTTKRELEDREALPL